MLVAAIIAGGTGALGTFLLMRSDTPLIHQLTGVSGFTAAAAIGNDAHAKLEELTESLITGLQASRRRHNQRRPPTDFDDVR